MRRVFFRNILHSLTVVLGTPPQAQDLTVHTQDYAASPTYTGRLQFLTRPFTATANAGAFLLCVLLAFWVHLPGQVPYDGITVWYEARNAVHFSQHPPALALLWRWADLVVEGPAALAALQILVLWLAVFLLVHWTKPPALLAVFFYGLLFTWPALFAAVSLLVKDVLGAHLLLLAAVVGLLRPGRTTAAQTMTVLALACFAALVRYQYALVAVILLAAIAWNNRANFRYAGRLVASGVASVVGVAAAVSLLVALTFTPTVREMPDPPSSLRKIMVFDIAGALAEGHDGRLAVFEDQGVDVSALKAKNAELFTPYRVDSLWDPGGVFALLDAVPNAAIFAQWIAVARESPGAFLAHRGAAFARVLGFHDVYKCWPYYSGISKLPTDLAAGVGASSYARSISAGVMRDRLFPAGSFIFRPWVYALGALGVLALALLKHAPFAAGVLAASGLLYELTFLFLPQACDVRYSYFLMTTAAFGAALTAFSWADRTAFRWKG
jgi:hypothetical protein